MISVEQAVEIISEHTNLIDSEQVPLEKSLGRILRETIYADRDFPPFHRVAMDGIAIQFGAFTSGIRQFKIEGQNPAGEAPKKLTNASGCIEVATGSVLPEGADTVIPYEQIQIEDQQANVLTENVLFQQNIHFQAFDQKRGDVLLTPGKSISPAEIAVLATVGQAAVQVSKIIRIAILSTGDELVKIDATPLPWQIRLSNPFAIKSLLKKFPVEVEHFHSVDVFEVVENLVKKILAEYDVIVLTGGVSAGKRDFIPDVLRQNGMETLFHKVSQRPGKPILFGQVPNGARVFALPGNPVSALMCTCKYVLPWILKTQGAIASPEYAFLAEPLEFKPDLTWFVPVKIENQNGMLRAWPKPGHGSGDLANLIAADGFLELPKGPNLYETDKPYPLIRYRI